MRSLLVAAFAAAAVRADTPAHCLYADLQGVWELFLGPSGFTNDLQCPSDPAALQVKQSFMVKLLGPDIAVGRSGQPGFWTTMYDEGYDLRVDNQAFFAFSNWTLNAAGNATSFCGRTNVGFYHDWPAPAAGQPPANWGCFYAHKVAEDAFAPTRVQQLEPELHAIAARKYAAAAAPLRSFSSVSAAAAGSKQAHSAGAAADETVVQPDPAFAAAINAHQKLWTAKAEPAFVGMPLSQAQRRKGERLLSDRYAAAKDAAAASGSEAARLSALQHYRDSVHSSPATPVLPAATLAAAAQGLLPSNFTWQNVSGVGYVCPVRDQGQCGSCYSFGSTGAQCARTAIQLGRPGGADLFLSPQTVVSCSPLSQGCDGGFSYLVYKYMYDFGVPLEQCFPYASGSGVAPPCSQRCNDSSLNRFTSEYKFVGGFYGAATAELMQWEILLNGPISVEFMVYNDFMAYSGGVYVHTGLDALSFNPWQPTNHEVMIVGWGETSEGVPYWIVQNSWSAAWGLEGFFLIKRGVDECNIESIPAAAVPAVALH